MSARDPRIDAYIGNAQPFARPILRFLRTAVHAGCPDVEETLKWRNPAFMYKGILAGMAAFRQHVAFGFWKASALKVPGGKEQEAMWQFGRITSIDDLPDRKTLVRLVKQAAELHDKGVKAPRRKHPPRRPIPEPDYFLAALARNRKALKTYESLSPSHKREYLEWITEAKREQTRNTRLATAIQWMAEGKQRNWKYVGRR